jgi:hypothetical protein
MILSKKKQKKKKRMRKIQSQQLESSVKEVRTHTES